jgi:lysophospholipid acyltransferase (LPLAT)-like uncharacterized protein
MVRARPSRGELNAADHRRAAVFSTICRFALWTLCHTTRLRTVNEPELPSFRQLGPGPLLFALWHGDYFPIYQYARQSRLYIVVSRSPDGEILARILAAAGYRTVRGSTSRGATRAMIDLAKVVKGGADAAVAVDGPKGPRDVAKPGIVLLAKLTGCPIVPLGGALSRYKQFSSWDRFRLPIPPSRAVALAGSPIQVPPDATSEVIEARRAELEASLLSLRDQAHQWLAKDRFGQAERPRGFAASFAD